MGRLSSALALAAAMVLAGCDMGVPAPSAVSAPSGVRSTAASTAPPSPRVGEGGLALDPLAPDPAFVAAARSSCLKEMVADPAIPLIVQDRRRPDLTALYFEGPAEYLVQLVERRGDGSFVCTEGSGGSLPFVRGVALTITDQAAISDRGLGGWLIAGHVDPSAKQVTIRRADGVELRASVAGGRFVAFWIGPPGIVGLTASDAAGREITRVDDPIELGGGIP